APEVDAVADVVDAVARVQAQAVHLVELLPVLTEEDVGDAGERALGGDEREAAQPSHVLVVVEAVDGMDGERHAREPRRDPPDAEHAGSGTDPIQIPPRASAARRLYRL